MDITKAVFVRSAASERDFPRDSGKRIIFAGKSNIKIFFKSMLLYSNKAGVSTEHARRHR